VTKNTVFQMTIDRYRNTFYYNSLIEFKNQ